MAFSSQQHNTNQPLLRNLIHKQILEDPNQTQPVAPNMIDSSLNLESFPFSNTYNYNFNENSANWPFSFDSFRHSQLFASGERGRALQMNSAFSKLRGLIPTEPPGRHLSKIEILRLAKRYIEHLNTILQTNGELDCMEFSEIQKISNGDVNLNGQTINASKWILTTEENNCKLNLGFKEVLTGNLPFQAQEIQGVLNRTDKTKKLEVCTFCLHEKRHHF